MSPHGVEPIRYMKKKDSNRAIHCDPKYGPLFGNNTSYICIADNCNEESSNWINNPFYFQYECHSE